MGEAKRRRHLDPNWGKATLISETFETCKELFRPRTVEGETTLRWGIFDFYRIAFENDAPGVTMLDCSQGLAGTDNLPGFQGSPVFLGSRFIPLDAILHVDNPQLPIEEIKHLAKETDFSSDRITVMRLRVGNDSSDLLAVVPIASIQSGLEAT